MSLADFAPLIQEALNQEKKQEAIMLLAQGKRKEMTELIVSEIKKSTYIHTIRDDERPEMYLYHEGIYKPQAQTYIKEYCRQMLQEAFTTHLANEVINKLMADTYIDQEAFFKEPPLQLIPLDHGIYDLHTNKLLPHTPDIIFTKKLPITYDSKADCPSIKQHLKTVLPHEQDIEVIQEIIGSTLLREYKWEKAFMFIGDGRNGKGKTIEIIKRFLGPENCSSLPLQKIETSNFMLSELHGKLANLAGDISGTALKETAWFKATTGRDLLTADRKYKLPINFTNYAKMIFSCNELPRTYDMTLAFFNRWIILVFPYTFLSLDEKAQLKAEDQKMVKECDPSIIDRLTTPEELSGLFNWALEGLTRLLEKNTFSYSKSTEQVKNLWLRKSDSFAAFLMDCCLEEFEARIAKSELRRAYAQYCRHHKVKPVSDKSIARSLSEMGVTELRCQITVDDYGVKDRVLVWEGLKPVRGGLDTRGFFTFLGISNSYIRSNTPDTASKSDAEEYPGVSEEVIE